jgi:hypothetical protein
MRCQRSGGYCSRPECIRVNKCKYYQTQAEYDPSYTDLNYSHEIISSGAVLIVDTVDRPYSGGGGDFGGGGSSSSYSDSSSDSGSSDSGSSGGGE